MNKKKVNILLVLGVVAVWVLIVIKIISYNSKPAIDASLNDNKTFTGESVFLKDSIIIYANYRDPFLSSVVRIIPSSKIREPQIDPVQTLSKSHVSWPTISYGGMVKKLKDGSEFILIGISDKTLVLEREKEVAGIKILALYPDSLKVKYNNETKMILKK